MTVGAVRVAVDRDLCIGAGNCVRLAPGVFDQSDDDGVVVLLVERPGDDQHAAAREAVAACPTGAITLTDTADQPGGNP